MVAGRRSPSLVDVLEALYDLEQPRIDWFRSVLKAVSKSFDRGSGVGMVLHDTSGELTRVEAIDAVNVSQANYELGIMFHQHAALEAAVLRSFRNDVCATLVEKVRDPDLLRFMREHYARIGLRDELMINGANPSGHGLTLFVFSATMFTLTTAERMQMTRLATHFAAAYRLQRRLDASGSARLNGADAVLRTDGRVEHAEPAAASKLARGDLTDAVKQREWARTPRRRAEADGVIAAWKPLVAGQWSLVDVYEENGRRYVTARENMPASNGVRPLSSRERQVASLADLGHSNKLIAYELGLAHSTVRVLLARAAAKMGVRTRSELIARVRAQPLNP
jgi:DNA-binding NarL/FixJ family response regulator